MQAPEDSLGFLAWEGPDIPPNVSLTGFRIAVSEPDTSYDPISLEGIFEFIG